MAVQGSELICYPRWKYKREVSVSRITARKTKVMDASREYLEIVYYVEDEELIRVNTRMENVNRLDGMVRKSIAERNEFSDLL